MQRAAARAAAACCGLVVAQVGVLAATYETPLDAAGPHLGVCSPTHAAGPAAHRGAEYAHSGSSFADFAAARALWRRRSQQAPTAGGGDEAGPSPRRTALFRSSRGDAEAQAHGKSNGRKVRCIVLGDSLVSGVGSAVSGSPALPQRFAAALAERLGAQVTWRALGKTGADVAAMRSALLPHLRAEAAAAPDAAPTVLLLLCGLNDFKRAHRGATSSAFHEDLSALVAEVRDICGPHTLVVLPALPLAATARFPVPLHWLVCALGARYDEQKRKLAQRFARSGRVLFVDAPALPAADEVPALLSGDGVHPNDAGYGLWGAHIAEAVATHLRARGGSS